MTWIVLVSWTSLWICGERLPRLRRVLGEQRPRLPRGEVAQTQRLRLDVEGAAAEHEGLLGGGMDAVVPHVPHAAQDDALRQAGGPARVARAQLPQHRQHGVPHQRVDLVDQQRQRPVGHAPAKQSLTERLTRPRPVQHAGPDAFQRLVAKGHARLERPLGQDGAHALRSVLAHRLAGLHVGVHAAVVVAGIQQVAQGQQCRRLPGLPGRVKHEVPLRRERGRAARRGPRGRGTGRDSACPPGWGPRC